MLHLRSTTIVAGLLAVAVTAAGRRGGFGGADRRRQGGGHADHDRAAARLVRLRRRDRGLQGQVSASTVNELNPDAGSGDEIEAIKANKDNKGPQAPDVIDVGLSFGPSAKAEGLIQPYKVSTWDTIPDSAKDADGYWYGDYYGVLAFEVNKDLVTERAGRLGRPAEARIRQRGGARRRPARLEPGDPGRLCRRPRRPAAAAGEAAGEAGLEFFAELNKARATSCRSSARPRTLAQGATPIVIRWDYNALAGRDTLNGNPPVEVVVPKTGVVAGVYVQAISAYAPHPNAAKLWMEYLYSDEGQLGWLEGLLPPDPLQRPGQERQGPAGAARQAAAGRGLRGGGLPDARRAGRAAKEAITKQLGQPSSAPTSSKLTLAGRPAARRPARDDRQPAHGRSRPIRAASSAARARCGLARHRAVLRLRAAVPDPADAAYLIVGAFQNADGRVHAREHRQPLHSRRSSAPTGSRIQDQLRLGLPRLR